MRPPLPPESINGVLTLLVCNHSILCPVRGCKHRHPPTDTASQFSSHLKLTHPNISTASFPPTYWTRSQLHHCLICTSTSTNFTRINELTRHTNRYHLQLFRDHTNSSLIAEIVRPPLHHNWTEALAYLQILKLQPPPTRASLYNKTSYSTKHEYWTALHKIHLLILAATPPLDDNNANPKTERTASPFWKIALHFETLILGTHDITTRKPNLIIQARLQAFRNGDLKPLFQAAFNPDLYHATGKPPTFENAHIHSQAAQDAANEDNYRTAHNRIQSQLPVASLTPERITKILTLFPPRIPYTNSSHTPRPNTRNASDTLLQPQPIIIDNITLQRTLKKWQGPKQQVLSQLPLIRSRTTHSTPQVNPQTATPHTPTSALFAKSSIS
jgi:hypothetical protein